MTVAEKGTTATDAPALGEGRCERCQQVRPLFLHTQERVRKWLKEPHDCPSCVCDEEEQETTTTVKANLCPRCWSATPEKYVTDET